MIPNSKEALHLGQNTVLLPDLLQNGEAAAIKNMHLDAHDVWRAIDVDSKGMTPITNISTAKAYPWQPSMLPTGVVGSTIYIQFLPDQIDIYTSDGAENFTTTTFHVPVNNTTVRVAWDSNQFVFIDGRDYNLARRIFIDNTGALAIGIIGGNQPVKMPTITAIDFDFTVDLENTGLPAGCTLQYYVSIRNRYGEESKPSPCTIVDTTQYKTKGTNSNGTYTYDRDCKGTIRLVTIQWENTDLDAQEAFLYRAYALYSESILPLSTPVLVDSMRIAGAGTFTFKDSNPSTTEAIDWNKDPAPAGDDITIASDTLYIANAVNLITFPFEYSQVWRITIKNPNSQHYIKRPLRLELWSSSDTIIAGQAYFNAFDYADFNGNYKNYRFIDTDGITPIRSWYIHPTSSAFYDPAAAQAGILLHHAILLLPELRANSTKEIYLVKFNTALEDTDYMYYPRKITTVAEMQSWVDTQNINPLKNENTLVNVSATQPPSTDPQLTGIYQHRMNKANYYMETTYGNLVVQDEHFMPTFAKIDNAPTPMFPTRAKLIQITTTAANYNNDGISLAPTGYFYIYAEWDWNSAAPGAEVWVPIAEIDCDGDNPGIQIDVTTNYTALGTVSRILVRTTVIGGTPTVTSTITHVIPAGVSVPTRPTAFILTSWKNLYAAGAGTSDQLEVTTQIIHPYINPSTGSNYGYGYAIATAGNIIVADGNVLNLNINVTGAKNNWIGDYALVNGEYIPYTSGQRVFQIAQGLPDYPIQPVGACMEFCSGGGNTYYLNSNIFIEDLTSTINNSRRPGIIQWSTFGNMSAINQHNTGEDIYRIIAVKSYQATDEHGTVWYNSEKGWSLISHNPNGDIGSIPTIRNNVLLLPSLLIATNEGIAWIDRNYILNTYSQAGHREVSKKRILLTNPLYIMEKPDTYEILIYDDPGKTDDFHHLYNYLKDAFSMIENIIIPKLINFLPYTDSTPDCYVCIFDSDDNPYPVLYTDPNTVTGIINTRSLGSVIRRFRFHGDKVTLNIPLITGYVRSVRLAIDTPTATVPYAKDNTWYAIPGARGEQVWLQFSGLNNISHFEHEVQQ